MTTSLTKVAITTRRTIRYSIYLIIFLIIGRMLFDLGLSIYLRVFPPPPPPPTVAFGRLPRMKFPEKKDLPSLTYTLETPEGGFPVLPEQALIYYMPKLSSHLLAVDVARSKAARLGFSGEPEKVTDTIYRFREPSSPQTLEMNIVTGVFSLSYDFSLDTSPLEKRPPTPDVAASYARSYLSGAGYLNEDLSAGTVTHEFLKTENQELRPALSLSEANLIKVNFFRKALNEIPTKTPDPEQSNVWFLVSGGDLRGKQILAGEYHYFPIDETQSSTYPLRTAQEAFEELKAGRGYIASLGLNQDGKVTIRRVYLAYYDAGEFTEFYQPIIVFEGDRSFVSYVPAIKPEVMQPN